MIITARALGKLIGVFLLVFSIFMIVRNCFFNGSFNITEIFAATATGLLLLVISFQNKTLE